MYNPNKPEFHAVFQLSKTQLFSVDYYTCGSNEHPYFATQADEFMRNKKDYRMGGQAQACVTRGHLTARNFWKKWDVCHLKDLTDEQYTEMREDLKKLMAMYNYLIDEQAEDKQTIHDFGFYTLAQWSKQNPKKGVK